MTQAQAVCLPGQRALALLAELNGWGKTTTIILHGGCVFEFKGVFPAGSESQGYYNLHNDGSGFEGHINPERIARISFQTKPHRGRESYALVFEDFSGDPIFKVFLGRDEAGELLRSQLVKFNQLMAEASEEPAQ